MKCRPDETNVMVLYHAVSSYQLLEVMLHRMAFHPDDRAVLVLPDFVTRKYPQFRNLISGGFFSEVYLFPYLQIPHGSEGQIMADVSRYCQSCIPHEMTEFSHIYAAGAHFYFTLYLILHRIPFVFLEDAAGMVSRPEILEQALAVHYPLHAAIGQKYGLFDGSNPLIQEIICLKRAQKDGWDRTIRDSVSEVQDFSVERQLEQLEPGMRRKIVRFFLRRRIWTRTEAILLTQQFSGLGMMTRQEQAELYERLYQKKLRGIRLLIKRHPDDALDYRRIFPRAKILRQIFPAELLPYVFWRKPKKIYTFDSTGCENLGEHFEICRISRVQLQEECREK